MDCDPLCHRAKASAEASQKNALLARLHNYRVCVIEHLTAGGSKSMGSVILPPDAECFWDSRSEGGKLTNLVPITPQPSWVGWIE